MVGSSKGHGWLGGEHFACSMRSTRSGTRSSFFGSITAGTCTADVEPGGRGDASQDRGHADLGGAGGASDLAISVASGAGVATPASGRVSVGHDGGVALRTSVVAAGCLTLGAVGGYFADAVLFADPIEPVRVSQFYGTVQSHEGDRLCIRGDERVRCGRLRLRPEDQIAPVGSPARGGYAVVPSDSSDLPEPSWLWVSQLSP